MHVGGVEHSACSCCQALVMNVVRMAAKSTRKTESGTLSSGILRCGCNDTSRNVSQRVGGEIFVLNHCTGSRPSIFFGRHWILIPEPQKLRALRSALVSQQAGAVGGLIYA